MIEIKNTVGQVIFTYEGDTLEGADLSGAKLSGANLYRANLYRANLSRADLSRADLSRANLSRTNLSGANLTDATMFGHKVTKTPIQITNLAWPILITEQAMQIGCQVYTHDEWESFDGDELGDMDDDAFEFAEKWRTILLSMCREHAK